MSDAQNNGRADHLPPPPHRLAAEALERLYRGAERDVRVMDTVSSGRALFHIVREPDVFLVVRHDSVGRPVAAVRFERTGERITITTEESRSFSVTVRPHATGECYFYLDDLDTGRPELQIRRQALHRLFFDAIG
jgi:hypothetical protein